MFTGIQYLDECPVEPHVPVYLLVGGIIGFIHLSSVLWRQIRTRRLHRGENEEFSNPADSDDGLGFPKETVILVNWALWIFLIVWFGVGNYWTLRIYRWGRNFISN